MRRNFVTRNQSVNPVFTSLSVLRQFLVVSFILVLLLACISAVQAYPHNPGQVQQVPEYSNEYPYSNSLQKSIVKIGWKSENAELTYLRASYFVEQGELIMAKRLLKPLAMEGHRDAQFLLGVVYDSTPAFDRDVDDLAEQSFAWYLAAAMQGHSDAQHNLALAYAHGEGVDVNLDKALQWWKKAALQGNSDSQYNLGVMYAVGLHGVKRDLKQARLWWHRAAKKGDPAAQYNLGALYASEATPFHNDCMALHWLMQSHNNGFKRAEAALHDMDTRGISASKCK